MAPPATATALTSTPAHSPAPISPLNHMITHFQSFLQNKQQQLTNLHNAASPRGTNANHPNRARQKRIQSAQSYMDARLAGHNDALLNLVSDDIVLTSSKDGRFEGKSNFRDYVSRVKASGNWGKATWNQALNMAEVQGNVKILMVKVPVLAHFAFDSRGKISTINVGTRRKVMPDGGGTVNENGK